MLTRILQEIDSFGVPVKLRTAQHGETYKTWIGGAITILTYSIYLAYAIWVIYSWQIGELLPRITSQLKVQNEIEFTFKEKFFELELLKDPSVTISQTPFSRRGNILLPLIVQQTHTDGTNTASIKPVFSETSTIELNELQLKLHPKTQQFTSFMLVPCQKRFLEGDQYCASDEEIVNYIKNLRSLVRMGIQLRQYDAESNSFKQVFKDSFLILEPDYTLLNNIRLQSTIVDYDSGFLFPDITSTETLSDYSSVSQVVTTTYLNQVLKGEYYPRLSIILQVDNLQYNQTIVKPKVSEVLAQIGSIFSILMTVSILAEKISSLLQENQILELLIKTQYPRYQELVIRKNLLGKIISVTWKEKEINISRFEVVMKSVRHHMIGYLELAKLIQKIIIIEKKLQLDEKFQIQDYTPHDTEKVRENQVVSAQEQLPNMSHDDLNYVFV